MQKHPLVSRPWPLPFGILKYCLKLYCTAFIWECVPRPGCHSVPAQRSEKSWQESVLFHQVGSDSGCLGWQRGPLPLVILPALTWCFRSSLGAWKGGCLLVDWMRICLMIKHVRPLCKWLSFCIFICEVSAQNFSKKNILCLISVYDERNGISNHFPWTKQ